MKVLSLSDKVVPYIYSPQVRQKYPDIDVIIGCGDLSYFYLEYIMSVLDKPLFFVRGNHDKVAEYSSKIMRTRPHGGTNLHRKVVRHEGVTIAGVEGSMRYRPGKYQYSQSEMWSHVFSLVPIMMYNRRRYGQYLDIFVTHAPPQDIHDANDLPHQGIKAFRWLLRVFKPLVHFHGHVHIYRPDEVVKTEFGSTMIVNTYPNCYTELELDGNRS